MHPQLAPLLLTKLIATTPAISLRIHLAQIFRVNRPVTVFIVIGPEVAVEIWFRLACVTYTLSGTRLVEIKPMNKWNKRTTCTMKV
jgi:hypothetical protein